MIYYQAQWRARQTEIEKKIYTHRVALRSNQYLPFLLFPFSPLVKVVYIVLFQSLNKMHLSVY